MSSIKICQFSSSYPPIKDGVGDFVAKLHRIFNENNIQSIVVTSSRIKEQEKIIPFFKYYSLSEIIKSIRLLKQEDIKAVIFHYPTTYYGRRFLISFIPLVYRLFGFTVILYLHEFHSYSIFGKIRIYPLFLFCNNIITTDLLHKKSILKIFRLKNIDIIPGGINFPEKEIPKYRKIANESDKTKLLYFGFIKYGKGLEELLEVFRNDSEIHSNFELSIVGDLAESPQENDIILKNKVLENKHIIYHGFLNWQKFISYLPNFNFMLLPFKGGLTEKRGSFMTAMAFGLPVITTKPQIPIEGLKNWDNIIFYDHDSANSLEKILIEKIKFIDITQVQTLGQKGQNWYYNNYSEEMLLKKISKHLQIH